MVLVIGWVTLMHSGSPRVSISLHDIELWAPLAIDVVCVTVVGSRLSARRIAILVLGWQVNDGKGGIAAAARLGQIDIVLDGAAEQIHAIEIVWSHVVTSGQLVAGVVVHDDLVTALGRILSLANDVYGLILTVLFDLKLFIGSRSAHDHGKIFK